MRCLWLKATETGLHSYLQAYSSYALLTTDVTNTWFLSSMKLRVLQISRLCYYFVTHIESIRFSTIMKQYVSLQVFGLRELLTNDSTHSLMRIVMSAHESLQSQNCMRVLKPFARVHCLPWMSLPSGFSTV